MTAALSQVDEQPTFTQFVAAEARAHLARRMISNRRLAAQLGVGPAWIDRRLNGTTPMDTDDMELIASALNISLSDLLNDAIKRAESRPAIGAANRRYSAVSQTNVIAFPQVTGYASLADGHPLDCPSEDRGIA